MERVQLQFWNALTFLSTFLCLLLGISAVLAYGGHISDKLNVLTSIFPDSQFLRFFTFKANTCLVLAIGALAFALMAQFSDWRKRLWQQSSFLALPSPNGGYLRKVGSYQFKQELHRGEAKARRRAKYYFKLAEHYFANNLYQAAAAAYQNSANALPTMSAYLNLGTTLCYRSSFQKALDAFGTGLAIAKKNKDKELMSAFLCNTCIPHREQGNLTGALACFKQAFGICRSIQDSAGEACSQGNLGSLFLVQGRPEEALKPWRDAIQIFGKTNYHLGLAAALDGMGSVYSAKREYKSAFDYHSRGYKIYRRIRNIPGMTQSLANIGYTCLRLGRVRRSLKANRKALQLAGWLNSVLDRAKIHGNIGLIHQKKGKLGDALKSVEKAYGLYEDIGNPIGMGNELLAMGVIYTLQQRRAESLKKLGEARAKFLQSGVLSDSVEAAIEMALRTDQSAGRRRRKPTDFIHSLLLKVTHSS